MMAYEGIKRWMRRADAPAQQAQPPKTNEVLAATFLSKVFASSATYPLQVVRTVMQNRNIECDQATQYVDPTPAPSLPAADWRAVTL